MSNFFRIRCNIEIFGIRESELADLKSKLLRAQHNIMPNDGATRSSQEINKKSKESVVLRPFHHFPRPELTKRKIGEFFLGIQAFALTRMGGACAAGGSILVSSPSPSEIERMHRSIAGCQDIETNRKILSESEGRHGKERAAEG